MYAERYKLPDDAESEGEAIRRIADESSVSSLFD